MTVLRWCVVQTKVYSEEQAAAALAGKGLVVYLPLVKARRVNPRARPVVPLFPGYLFVQLDWEQVEISAINWVPGVVRLVDFGDGPVMVPDEVIEHVKRRVAEVQASGEGDMAQWRHGDLVRITSGPLRDLDAVFDQHLTGKGRARVLIESWAASSTEVELVALEKVGQPSGVGRAPPRCTVAGARKSHRWPRANPFAQGLIEDAGSLAFPIRRGA